MLCYVMLHYTMLCYIRLAGPAQGRWGGRGALPLQGPAGSPGLEPPRSFRKPFVYLMVCYWLLVGHCLVCMFIALCMFISIVCCLPLQGPEGSPGLEPPNSFRRPTLPLFYVNKQIHT